METIAVQRNFPNKVRCRKKRCLSLMNPHKNVAQNWKNATEAQSNREKREKGLALGDVRQLRQFTTALLLVNVGHRGRREHRVRWTVPMLKRACSVVSFFLCVGRSKRQPTRARRRCARGGVQRQNRLGFERSDLFYLCVSVTLWRFSTSCQTILWGFVWTCPLFDPYLIAVHGATLA